MPSSEALRVACADLLDPVEPRQIPRRGYWTLNRLEHGRMLQRPYSIDDLEFVLRSTRKDVDTYMSQGFFSRPCRRAIHLAYATHAYVDLDVYNVPTWAGRSPEAITFALVQYANDNDILSPSMIISSGRGIYAKWFWDEPIPRAEVGRAVAVNRALVKLFAEFGADSAAVDMSRILRVIGTINSKTGNVARVLWANECDSSPITYAFDSFADEVLPHSLEHYRERRAESPELRAKRDAELRTLPHARTRRRSQQYAAERRKGNQPGFSREDWHWGILEDIRRLADMRYGGRVQYATPHNKVGADIFGHVGACQLAMVMPASELWHEIQAWAREILPREYVNGPDFRRHCSTLLANAKDAALGEKVDWCGSRRPPIWTYRKTTLIDLLEITEAEQRFMTRLISDDEKRRRGREAWRASHSGMSREEWLAAVQNGSLQQTRPWETEGISRATWFRRARA